MSKITGEEIKKILPFKGPSFEEVKNYLEKYNDEYIVIKCGGSVLVRILKQVTIDDSAEADRVFSMLMGDDVPPRRDFIERNAKYANIDA